MDVLGIILAGGRGDRLYPLTKDRAKPAVPFGGKYRIVDFVLSNFVNSGIYSIYVLTQFKSQSLMEHLQEAWQISDVLGDRFITPVPAQMRRDEEWYQGTANSVFQNLYLIERHDPELVAIFGADHVYRMNIRQMIEEHRAKRAEVTVAVLPVKVEEGPAFGIVSVDRDMRIIGFDEKPSMPKPIPGEPTYCLASMGNYLFGKNAIIDALEVDNRNPASNHDFAKDILPALMNKRKVYAYDFRKNRIPLPSKGEESSYWRDVGTIEAYFEANMDLRSVDPCFNLYNRSWPLRTAGYGDPPAKFVFDEETRRGVAINSIVEEGTIISGSEVRRSVIGRNVRVHSYSLIEDSIIMDWVEIGRNCKIRRTIIDKHNTIPSDAVIGYDMNRDNEHYFVSEGGIVVVPRAQPKKMWTNPSTREESAS
jgi:glucose-1-phosphate adenylyltransferase